jgi:ribulose-bisphosphate carboxylase large chain
MERVLATYLIETPLELDQTTAYLAGEQSSGTFIAVPGETDALKQRFVGTTRRIHPWTDVRWCSKAGRWVRSITWIQS